MHLFRPGRKKSGLTPHTLETFSHPLYLSKVASVICRQKRVDNFILAVCRIL